MFHRILAAVDGSERAPDVLDLATEIARMSGARLYVLRVVTIPPEFPPAAAGSPTDPLIARMAARAMQELSRLMAGVSDGVSMQPPIVRLGAPWKVILETGNERDVDLIILGSHGYQGWDRVLGTTAGKVANSASRSVLVAHGRRRASATPPEKGPSDPDQRRGDGDLKTNASQARSRRVTRNRLRTLN